MPHARTRLAAALGAAAALSLGLGASGAQAAPVLHCEASALRATIGGQAAIEPVTQGRGTTCASGSATPVADLPPLLHAQALIATTGFDSVGGRGDATGGVTQLQVLTTPPIVNQLPTEQFIDALPSITIPLALPIPVPGAPTSITVDIRNAVRALVPTPGTSLLSAEILTATAAVGCTGGAPDLSGSSQIAGLKLLGQDIGLNGALDQILPLIDTQHIDLSRLDLSKVSILTPLGPLSLGTVQAVIGPALAALPPIDIPASLLHAKLTPNEQTRDANSLTQRALHAELSLAGQPVLDAVFGEAKVSADAGTCAPPAAPLTSAPKPPAPKAPPVSGAGSVADQILACSDRKLVLIDVLRQGSRVKLLGAANRDYVGRRVAIRLRATGKVVAHAVVRKDGSFQTYAAAPPRAMLATHARANTVRYRAEIGRELSLPLKLQRRLVVSSMSSRNGKVTIKGRVARPLTKPVSTIRLVRRVSCHKVVLVARFKPRADGTFSITVKAPKGQSAAVYRLATRVREKYTNPRTYPTFSLPRGVALNTR